MAKQYHLTDSDRADESADLLEMQKLNNEIDEREKRKRVLASRINARYQAVTPKAAPLDIAAGPTPQFDDPIQQYGFEYLKTVRRSRTKPIAHYIVQKGHGLRASNKPGLQVMQAFKMRPDVFGYEAEEWFLLPPEAWNQKKTGAS